MSLEVIPPPPELPSDLLIEIFGWCLEQYSFFRVLSKTTNRLKTPWDGWDSLIEQGVKVEIKKWWIFWNLKGELHSRKIPGKELPAIEYISVEDPWASRHWFQKGIVSERMDCHRET